MLSFAGDIRPLFTQEDIEHMLRVDPSLNLGSYNSVKAHASINHGSGASLARRQPVLEL